MSVSLADVALAARARQASLAAESAGYLVLAVADQVALAARAVRREAVELNHDGGIRLRAGDPASEAEAERQLRVLLAELLQAASSVTPALLRVASKSSLSSLGGLVAELEAALIPVNRAAARRALARLSRETARALEQGLLPESTPQAAAAPEPAPEVQRSIEPEPPSTPIEVDIEFTPEPLVETRPEPLAARRASSVPPAPLARTPRLGTLVAPCEPEPQPEPPPVVEARTPRSREPRRSELGTLLQSFASVDGPSEPELRGELKKIAGIEPTPPPGRGR